MILPFLKSKVKPKLLRFSRLGRVQRWERTTDLKGLPGSADRVETASPEPGGNEGNPGERRDIPASADGEERHCCAVRRQALRDVRPGGKGLRRRQNEVSAGSNRVPPR